MDMVLAAIAPVMIVIVEALKQAGVPTRWLPVLAILGGALLGLVYALTTGSDLLSGALGGILAGGAAAGIYDAGKSVISRS